MEENTEDEIKLLLDGVIPERNDEMRGYLNKYAPYFTRCDDRPGFVVEAGAYGILKFTQRTMHQMWILGFAANQALHSYSSIIVILRMNSGQLNTKELDEIPDQRIEEGKYKKLLESVYELARVNNLSEFSWPSTVPKPENKKPSDVEGAATFDLICMSGAYVFLHEMKHIAFSIDNNAPSNPHEEELECDLFAKNMMLGELELYSKHSGYDLGRLISKRAMSISLALFYMLVLTPSASWAGGKTHPSIKNRIESMVNELSVHDDDILWIYIASLLLSHLRYLNNETFFLEFKTLKSLTMTLMSRIENASNRVAGRLNPEAPPHPHGAGHRDYRAVTG